MSKSRSLRSRSKDIYRLKAYYRVMTWSFLFVGLLLGFWPVVANGYQWQIAWGLTPGAPIGSEPGSITFALLFLPALLGAGVLGMTLGALLLCMVFTVFEKMPLRDSARAVFLSHYPSAWFRN